MSRLQSEEYRNLTDGWTQSMCNSPCSHSHATVLHFESCPRHISPTQIKQWANVRETWYHKFGAKVWPTRYRKYVAMGYPKTCNIAAANWFYDIKLFEHLTRRTCAGQFLLLHNEWHWQLGRDHGWRSTICGYWLLTIYKFHRVELNKQNQQ